MSHKTHESVFMQQIKHLFKSFYDIAPLKPEKKMLCLKHVLISLLEIYIYKPTFKV